MNEERNHDVSVLATEPLLSNSVHQTDKNNGNNNDDQIVRYPTQARQQEEEDQHQSFLHFILRSQGPPQLVILSLLFALALGATVGVVPAVLTDQYAKLYYGFDLYDHCSNYSTKDSKPQPCLDGSSDAQTAAAISSFISNAFTFFTSSVIGTLSDQYGRRGFLILGQFLSCLAPTALVLIQMFPTVKPQWYYIATSLSGMISWISIALSSLSDVVPNHWRAPVFGLLLSAFSLGFAFSPSLALKMTHYTVSMVSFILLLFGLLYSIVSLPETLTEDARVSVYE
jgi:MFS family permease